MTNDLLDIRGLHDLKVFSSYIQIKQAVQTFNRLIQDSIVSSDELASLAIRLADKVFDHLEGWIEFEDSIRDDHLKKGRLNLFVSFFPAYAAMAKGPHQIVIAKRLFRLYGPFTNTGIIRPSALKMLIEDPGLSGLGQPQLYDRRGRVLMYPSHYGYVFGSIPFINPTHDFLGRKNGLRRAIESAKDPELPLKERVLIEADIHRIVSLLGYSREKDPLQLVEENILTVSKITSQTMNCMFSCFRLRHPVSMIDQIAKDLGSVSESHRHMVFEQISKFSANMIQAKREGWEIDAIIRSFVYLFSSLKPLGFDPLDQALDMIGANSEQNKEIVTALYDRAAQIRSSEEDKLIGQIAWIDGIFLTLDPEWVMAQRPSAKAVAYLYSLTENDVYRNHLKKSAEGCEALLPGDLGL